LKTDAICIVNNGFDSRLHDSAARQFHQDVVADFVFAHFLLAYSAPDSMQNRQGIEEQSSFPWIIINSRSHGVNP
jgi:hypothetical protein